ncbi:acyl-CoA dehydrogenase family protein [Kitasatospora sp. NPDC004240]
MTGHAPAPHGPAPGEADPDPGFRAEVRAHLAAAVLPHAEEWERAGRIPAEGWRELGRRGLLALDHAGPGFLRSAVLLEELGRTGYAGIRAAVGVHAYMARSYLELFATDGQRAALLPGVLSGERIAALAITEDGAGTDLRHLATRARATDDGGYRVDGVKQHIANGSAADLLVTLVRTKEPAAARGLGGVSLLLVDAGAPGVTREPLGTLGWRAADVCRVALEDVPVPPGRVLGRPHQAFPLLMRALDFERLAAGLLALGGVRHCLDLLHRFVHGHHVRDAPLGDRQAVRHRLADLTAEAELVRHYAHHAARLHARGGLDTRTAAILKLRATELAVTAAQTCLRFHGARGYLDDATAARLYRDAMAGTIAAGASELMRDLIFEETPRLP